MILLAFDDGEFEQLEPEDVVRDGDRVMFSLIGLKDVIAVAMWRLRLDANFRASIDGAMYDLVSASPVSIEDRIDGTRTTRFCAPFVLP